MFQIYDFFIGLFLANSLPHFVLGMVGARFLCLFGFSPKANIFYALWNLAVAVCLGVYFYGVGFLSSNGFFLGNLFVLVGYFVVGRFLYVRWHIQQKSP